MRVMVTGGAGYIGSVVTEELVKAGDDVVVLDNLSKGHREMVVEGAKLIVGDIADGALVERVLRVHQVQAVVHMAAQSLVGESVADPAKYYRANVAASLALADAMKSAGVKHLVFSSTAATYGEPEKQPIDETAPTTPTNPYGQTKLAFEQALRWYDAAYGFRYVSLRYFNAAGATAHCGELHDPETHLIPLLLQAAAGRRPKVTLFGDDYATPDGTCIRDYIHVVDLAAAHVLALRALVDKALPSRIYNLGCGGRGFSVKEVVDAVERVTARQVPVEIGPRRAGDPAVLIASSEAIIRELGWKPTRSLDDTIQSAWNFLMDPR